MLKFPALGTVYPIITIITLSLFSNSTIAETSKAAVRIHTGMLAYSFEQKAFFSLNEADSSSSALSKQEISDSLPYVGSGVTFFFGDFYFDTYAQASFSGSDNLIIKGNTLSPAGGGSFNYEPFIRPVDSEWDRTEFSFTTGYAVTSRFKIYAGYRVSETSVDQRGSSRNLLTSASQTFTNKQTYSQNGFFLGGNYAWSFDDSDTLLNGALSANAGLAFVDGDIKEQFAFTGSNTVTTIRDGNTVGIVMGLAWNGLLGKLSNKNIYYALAINRYRYDFEASNSSSDADFSESVTQFNLSFSMPFTL